MLSFMTESQGDLLAIRAGGRLSAADYEQVLIPRLEQLLQNHRRLRVLFYMDESFTGWDLDAAWHNTRLDFRHRADFERIAIVGAPAWEEWCVRLAAHLIKGEIRTFPRHALAEALAWIGAAAAAGRDPAALWAIEEDLWLRGAEAFAAALDPACLMAFAAPVGILQGEGITASLKDAPRWAEIAMTERRVAEPAADLAVLAYRAEGRRPGSDPYRAFCTSTYRRTGAGWRLVQHQQTPA